MLIWSPPEKCFSPFCNEIKHAARVLSRYRDARRTRILRIRLRLTVRVKKGTKALPPLTELWFPLYIISQNNIYKSAQCSPQISDERYYSPQQCTAKIFALREQHRMSPYCSLDQGAIFTVRMPRTGYCAAGAVPCPASP